MTLKELQDRVDQWITSVGVRYFNELTNTVILSEEVGEFSSLMARAYGEQSFKNPEDQKKVKENLESELADILFVLSCLANQLEINLESAIEKNLKKKTIRDQDRHFNNPKLK